MKIVSIDPGKTGGCALIVDGKLLTTFDMPLTKGSKFVDLVTLAAAIKDFKPDVGIIEQVHASPGAGVSGMFYFGANFGGVIGIFVGLEIPLHQITPQKWKTIQGLAKKDKDASRLKIIDLYPEMAKEFKFKNSVDRAEAALLGLAWLKILQ